MYSLINETLDRAMQYAILTAQDRVLSVVYDFIEHMFWTCTPSLVGWDDWRPDLEIFRTRESSNRCFHQAA